MGDGKVFPLYQAYITEIIKYFCHAADAAACSQRRFSGGRW
jgi:hypothetical protein